MHAVYLPELDPGASRFLVEGEEREHALRVKRVRAGERVLALNGKGLALVCEVVEAKRTLALEVRERAEAARPGVRVSVWSALPKGPRAGDLIDMLSQAGAAAWRPLTTERGAAEMRDAKGERLRRVAVEAMKQSQRAWLLEIGAEASFEDALRAGDGERVVLADAGGAPYAPRRRDEAVRVLIGPEGGWSERERESAQGAGVEACSLGAHVMRIEVAAAVAAAVVIACARASGGA